jgi:hypothetical protein
MRPTKKVSHLRFKPQRLTFALAIRFSDGCAGRVSKKSISQKLVLDLYLPRSRILVNCLEMVQRQYILVL